MNVPAWLSMLAHLVPRELRPDWLREWAAEVAHARATGSSVVRLVPAVLADALHLLPDRIEAGIAVQDLRHAARSLRANRGFAAAAIVTLALGIGANTAIFSVVNGYLVRPLPLPAPDRIVMVTRARAGANLSSTSAPNYLDWRDRSTTIRDLAAVQRWSANLTGAGQPLRVTRSLATPGIFEMLGVSAALGRTFGADEKAADVVVLSHELWVDAFGGDREVVGRAVDIDGVRHTVIGVLPRGFRLPPMSAQVWAPLVFAPDALAARGRNNLLALGRLRDGAAREQAQAELDRIVAELARAYPRTNEGWGIAVTPVHDFAVASSARGLWTLLGAVGLVLLLTCANVANLILARGAARERELAVRAALGASRGRLLAQMLGESVLIALAGGALGLLLARAALDPIRALVPDDLAGVGDVSLDGRVLAFTLLVSVATGLIAGLAPALRLSTAARSGTLPSAAVLRVRGGGGRIRSGLTTVQFALATVLLVGAGLLARSLGELANVDVGVQTAGRSTFGVTFPDANYPEPERVIASVDGVLEALRAQPGVAAATALSHLPLSGARLTSSVALEGRPGPFDVNGPSAAIVVASPDAFEVLGIPLLRGRLPDERDRAGTDPVVVINATAASAFWPDADAVGRWLSYEGDANGDQVRRRVIGVVADTRYAGPAEPPVEMVYEPYAQTTGVWRWFGRSMVFVVRTSDGRVLPLRDAQAAVAAVAPDLPVIGLASLDDVLRGSIAAPRFHGILTSAFALLAVVIAVIGLYGLLSFSVRQRGRELGVRLALGARRQRVVADIVLHALRLAALGVAIGACVALALNGVLQALVWQVGTTDPITWMIVLASIGGATVAAAAIPAWRAAAVDPATALRAE